MEFLSPDEKLTQYESAKSVVFPCPYERTTSYLKGTQNGPSAILEASEQVEFFDSETATQAVDHGIHTLKPIAYSELTEEQCLTQTQTQCEQLFNDKKFPIVLGGEHTISICPIRAAAQVFGSDNLSVLHFDAHSDMRDSYEGNKYSHASIMRRVHESIKHTYSIGIRAQCLEERSYINDNPQIGILYDHEREKEGISIEKALSYLPTDNIYITIDLDYFNPETMPSVGTPVPGGGHWYETLFFLKKIFAHKNVVGADIVELKPDHDKRSDFFAAQLVYKLISYRFCG